MKDKAGYYGGAAGLESQAAPCAHNILVEAVVKRAVASRRRVVEEQRVLHNLRVEPLPHQIQLANFKGA